MAQKAQRSQSKSQDTARNTRTLKRKRDVESIDTLNERVAGLDAESTAAITLFSELPLSQATQEGLEASHFKTLTTIQASAIPLALQSRDILGAAKTGSGKTLTFLVPVLENLYRKRWTEYDGVGALILSPTRELAIQIFEVLRKIGRNHTFSAGLVIGGKPLQEERERLGRMNILVATPGRMLQHMDQTADLDISNLQMLVLDEADRIMDMGFSHALDAIVEHLPSSRQTLLFSATQSKKISDLARLSLTDPEFVSVHETASTATPAKLQQNYIVTPLPQKLDTLWSFIRSNTKKKVLVFLSSGKQVRFVYEAFRHLQPGVPLLHLHGGQKQTARLDITTRFSRAQHACLFATDVAARGLDFPSVDWVVQLDAPENADTYIHRVGRTARYDHEGHSVLFLDPSEEEGMLAALARKRVTLERINVKQKKMQESLRTQLQNMCFRDPELKYLGQKAFVNYVKSIHIQSDKETFDLKELDLEGYAASLGLPGAPRVKFTKGGDTKERKNMPRALAKMEQDLSEQEADDVPERARSTKAQEKQTVKTKYDRMFERRNQDVLAEHYSKLIQDDEDEASSTKDVTSQREQQRALADADSDDDFLAVKRRIDIDNDALEQAPSSNSDTETERQNTASQEPQIKLQDLGINPAVSTTKKKIQLSTNPDEPGLVVDSKRREKLLKSRKKLLKYKGHGTHLVFSDDDTAEGKERVFYEPGEEYARRTDASAERERFLREERERTSRADVEDKAVAKMRRREKREKRKQREKEMLAGHHSGSEDDGDLGDEGVQLLPYKEGVATPVKEERQKKWFERDDSEEERNESSTAARNSKKRRVQQFSAAEGADGEYPHEQPRTLEDLEALASGLLAR